MPRTLNILFFADFTVLEIKPELGTQGSIEIVYPRQKIYRTRV